MSYIHFDKTELINLNYSLSKELLRANKSGAFASTTIINCNTRKYHGLLVVPQPQIDGDWHVLLSSLDETIVQHEAAFNLGIHKYPGEYHPKGHKYLQDFTSEPIPKLTFRVGGAVLSRESVLVTNEDRILIKYTLEEAQSPTILRLQPFLAFRNRHHLNKANVFVNRKYEEVDNGIRLCMYLRYSDLFMQVSKKAEFVAAPDWYFNIEYLEEQRRGYDYQEDLYVPGYFEFSLKKGESVVFSAGIQPAKPRALKGLFTREVKRRIPLNSFENCLTNAAQQFIIAREGKTEIIAGYPWFGRWGRDSFIALPGLTLSTGQPKVCKAAIDTLLSELQDGLFPNMGEGAHAPLNSVDAPLWFFWALQKYVSHTGSSAKKIWKEYGEKIKMILQAYREGTDFNIKMQENGLIFAGQKGKALTWMDAVVGDQPTTPRIGLPVEISALWYNAICFSLEMAKKARDKSFIEEWASLPATIEQSFLETFWDEDKGYLADCVNGKATDWSLRPNQIFATSLPYKVISDESIRQSILIHVKNELLTTRGLRTLSPRDKAYRGSYSGNVLERDAAYHQGTCWPWLLGHFVEGYLEIYGKKAVKMVEKLLKDFENDMSNHGIGSISEIYDGDPPFTPRGAISQAWSVAELLRIHELIKDYKG